MISLLILLALHTSILARCTYLQTLIGAHDCDDINAEQSVPSIPGKPSNSTTNLVYHASHAILILTCHTNFPCSPFNSHRSNLAEPVRRLTQITLSPSVVDAGLYQLEKGVRETVSLLTLHCLLPSASVPSVFSLASLTCPVSRIASKGAKTCTIL
jgi:hypothetical protein